MIIILLLITITKKFSYPSFKISSFVLVQTQYSIYGFDHESINFQQEEEITVGHTVLCEL